MDVPVQATARYWKTPIREAQDHMMTRRPSRIPLAFAALLCAAASPQAVPATATAPAPAAAEAAPAGATTASTQAIRPDAAVDRQLRAVLTANGVTGTIDRSLPTRLGRSIIPKLQNLGRELFFDPVLSLHNDVACAACHDPSAGFADSQPIAIGVQAVGMIAGASRAGPRNQRRSPTITNSVFYPVLMWDGRFSAPSGDPFDNSQGFTFPLPEGTTKFPPNDPVVKTLVMAQAHLPVTELKEQAGYTGTKGTLGTQWDQFDDGLGSPVPLPDASGYRNDPIRAALEARINAAKGYRKKFALLFPEVNVGAPITFTMVAQALGEWEAAQVRADAPLDRFARGAINAMTEDQKQGALLFFGKANCVACHATSGNANEMFSDFKPHNIGVPQIAPTFGAGTGNFIFDGPGQNEDFGLENVTHDSNDRYKFRTAPLRNLARQPSFFHNGAFTSLDKAIRHHLDVGTSARTYDPALNKIPRDLRNMGPIEPVLATLDPLVANPIQLTDIEFNQLVAFVGEALLDPDDNRLFNCSERPAALPSRMQPLQFVDCPAR
jgi:cytochrome c peroxidase